MKLLFFIFALLAAALVRTQALAQSNDDLDRKGSEDSCRRGIPSGCYNLGVDAFNAGDKFTAIQQFRFSCDKQLAVACYQLGQLYEKSTELTKAYYWHAIAAAQGYDQAKSTLRTLESKLTPGELSALKSQIQKKEAPAN